MHWKPIKLSIPDTGILSFREDRLEARLKHFIMFYLN